MIIEQGANTNPMLASGYSCFIDSNSVDVPVEDAVIDFCTCDFECEYIELAFVDDSEEDYKNDWTSLIAKIVDPVGTIEFFIVDENDVETALTDATYGEFFDFTERKGYRVDWLKVKDTLGFGTYRLKTRVVNFGREIIKISHYFQICTFDEESANFTVRIESTNKGCITNGFDYRGLEWEKRIRIPGKIWKETPIPELESYENTLRVKKSIQDKVTREVTLQTELIPASIVDSLVYNDFLMDDLFITNYDIFNYRQYRKLPIRLLEIDEPEFYDQNTKSIGTYKFEINDGGTVKRNLQ